MWTLDFGMQITRGVQKRTEYSYKALSLVCSASLSNLLCFYCSRRGIEWLEMIVFDKFTEYPFQIIDGKRRNCHQSPSPPVPIKIVEWIYTFSKQSDFVNTWESQTCHI